MGKKTVVASTDELLKQVFSAISSVAKFAEDDLDPRTLEAFSKSGGGAMKKWLCGDKEISCELIAILSKEQALTIRMSFPISTPLKPEVTKSIAAPLFALSGHLLPGNLNLSRLQRITLLFQDQCTAANTKAFLKEIPLNLSERQKTVEALRTEIARAYPAVQTFSVEKDLIWQSQLGKPVKLSVDELAVLAGGDLASDDNPQFIVADICAIGGTAGYLAGGIGSIPGGVIGWHGGEILEDSPVINNPGPAAPSGPSGPSGPKVWYCFSRGTPVLTPNGLKAIEDFHPGDTVLALDSSGDWILDEVIRSEEHREPQQVFHLWMKDGTVLSVTAGHPMLTAQGWVYSENISIGSHLIGHSGEVVVASVSLQPLFTGGTYNLVTKTGGYAVGRCSAVTHGLTAQPLSRSVAI